MTSGISNLKINAGRLHRRLADLAAIGAIEGGGCARLALSDEDKAGRDHMHHIPWGRIAARPFLGVSARDRDDILDIVGEAISEGVR